MRKCHYVWDKIAGKVLIPMCWAVVHTNDMRRCYCRNEPKNYTDFEKEQFNKIVKEKNDYIKELEKEVSSLNRIIKKLCRH